MSSMATSQGLGDTLPGMASSIHEMMRNFYDVERALINNQGKLVPPQDAQFAEIRMYLKNYWEDIAAILRKFHAYAGAFIEMRQIGERCNEKQLSQLLAALLKNCEDCRSLAKALFDERNVSLEKYSEYKAGFKDTLHSSKLLANWRSKNGRPRLNGHYEGDNGLPRSVIDNPYPDGEEALDSFDKAYEVFQEDMRGLVTFFDGQVEMCKKYIIDGKAKNISWNEIEKLATKWKADRGVIMRAMKDIFRVCDAMIPAHATVGTSLLLIKSTDSAEVRFGKWYKELWSRLGTLLQKILH